jgi:sortase A
LSVLALLCLSAGAVTRQRLLVHDNVIGSPTDIGGESERRGDAVGRRKGSAGGAAHIVVRTLGEVLITLGVIVLLFVVYALYFTDVMSGRLQADASAELDQAWAEDRPPEVETGDRTAVGDPFSRLRIPAFGSDYAFTIQQGVHREALNVGPGHYEHTAQPGEPGNFAVAGHRIGKGAPFNQLGELRSCDPVVVETRDSFFVYRVMPMAEEIDGWDERVQADPRCARVPTLREAGEADGGPYGDTVGRKIVTPDRGDAVAPVPYREDGPLPKPQQAALLTLTTCHPEFSARERMIIHAVLTDQWAKDGDAGYERLLEQIGEA